MCHINVAATGHKIGETPQLMTPAGLANGVQTELLPADIIKVHALEKSFYNNKTFSIAVTCGRYCSNVAVKLLKGCVSAVQGLHILAFYVHRHSLF